MQNKPNFRNAEMDTTFFLTKDYENEIAFRLRENKPNQTQFQRQKMLPHLTINGRPEEHVAELKAIVLSRKKTNKVNGVSRK